MTINKSHGVTRTEKLLLQLCERSFLDLWSYPNPFNEDRKELCDLLAVFENQVFIFFDRENLQLENTDSDPLINWERWKRRVIEPQIRTASGAERYIRDGGRIFLDKNIKQPFPIPIDTASMIVHKIIVAHGDKEACMRSSEKNVYGSIAVSYSNDSMRVSRSPFFVHLDKSQPIHLFDSHNLPIILSELDTFFDFSEFLEAKIAAINKYDILAYCGEEDLLANYFLNYDEDTDRHFIGTKADNINGLFIGEGEWKDFTESDVYIRKKEADKVSYFWDELIQKTCKNALAGIVGGNADMFAGPSAIREMAKEPRFIRRALSEKMIDSIERFPESQSKLMYNLSFMPSFYLGKAYVFLQVRKNDIKDYENEYRPKRQKMLEIACGAAKNMFRELSMIIGIAIDAPKFTDRNSEDFLLFNCSEWTVEDKEYYEKANEGLRFFKSKNLNTKRITISEFPDAQ
jgi:hypothetical protein